MNLLITCSDHGDDGGGGYSVGDAGGSDDDADED